MGQEKVRREGKSLHGGSMDDHSKMSVEGVRSKENLGSTYDGRLSELGNYHVTPKEALPPVVGGAQAGGLETRREEAPTLEGNLIREEDGKEGRNEERDQLSDSNVTEDMGQGMSLKVGQSTPESGVTNNDQVVVKNRKKGWRRIL